MVACLPTGQRLALALFAMLALAVFGCERQPVVVVNESGKSPPAAVANAVATYFTGAEIQAETNAQRAEVRKALEDILALNVDELKAKRYADFSGAPNVRTVLEVVAGHVVPATPQALDAATFFADAKSPQAQAAVRGRLDALNKSNAPTRP